MLNRIVCFALIFAIACAAWAARPNASNGPGRRGRQAGAARRNNPAPAAQARVLEARVVAITAKTITYKYALSGKYLDLVNDFNTTVTQSILADDVTVRALKPIPLAEIKSGSTVVVQPADSKFSLPAQSIGVKGIYLHEKGARTPGGSLLTGTINTEATTPTLQVGNMSLQLRMLPNSGVFRQEVVTKDKVRPDQVVRVTIKTVDAKPVVSAIGIGADLSPRKTGDSKRAVPQAPMARIAPSAKKK